MKALITRSTGTMHISTEGRLTSVMIQIHIWIHNLDNHQYLLICSLAHCQSSLKISCKSVPKFCAKLLTYRQTDRQSYRQRRLHNLRVVRILRQKNDNSAHNFCDFCANSMLFSSRFLHFKLSNALLYDRVCHTSILGVSFI